MGIEIPVSRLEISELLGGSLPDPKSKVAPP
jgi:hypothetical protein